MNMGVADWEKKVLKMGLKLVAKKLGKTELVREQQLAATTNKPVKTLNNLILIASAKLKAPWQARQVKIFGQMFLWLMLKDTAYKDVFAWTLYKLLKSADKLIPLVEPYVKEPKDFYPNQWRDTLEETKRQRKEGKIPANAKSNTELMFTPTVQKKRLEKLNKR